MAWAGPPRTWKSPRSWIESTYGQSHPAAPICFSLPKRPPRPPTKTGEGRPVLRHGHLRRHEQGHDGINYSLASRDTIANLVEIHANATTFDAGVFIASCDKSVPALLMAIAGSTSPPSWSPAG